MKTKSMKRFSQTARERVMNKKVIVGNIVCVEYNMHCWLNIISWIHFLQKVLRFMVT